MQVTIPVLDKRGLREFGFTTGAIIAGLFGILFPYLFERDWPLWPWIVFGVFSMWALLAPTSLNPVYRGWMRLGILLSKVTTPIVLTLAFAIAILPAAIIMRLLRHDPMRREFRDIDSYRVQSTRPSIENMEKPY